VSREEPEAQKKKQLKLRDVRIINHCFCMKTRIPSALIHSLLRRNAVRGGHVPKRLLRISCKHNAEFHFTLRTKTGGGGGGGDKGGLHFFLVFSVAFTKGSGGGFIIAESSVEGTGGTSTC
jgi:hypothetical protein